MNEQDVIHKMDEIKRLVTEIAAGAGCYMRMYDDLLLAVEKKYGAHDARILRQASLMLAIDHAKEKVNAAMDELKECDDD